MEVGFYFAPSGTSAGAAVFSFPAIGTSAECIREAWFDIKFAEGNADPGFGLVAYPARPETTGLRDRSKIEGGLLLDNRPRAGFTMTSGAATANVTELVKTWLSGRGFPSQGRRVEPGQAVTIAVQPPSATSRETITIETSESGAPTAPTLRLHTSC